MAVQTFPSSTGPATLPDVGMLYYNGVTWSALYKSTVGGAVVEDEAKRTTRYMEYTLTVEGVVTLPAGAPSTDQAWMNLRQKLSVHGQELIYKGNGFGGLNINTPGGLKDVAFGPIPKVLDFQPLGAGHGAMIRWQVLVRIPELPATSTLVASTSLPPYRTRSPGWAAIRALGAGGVPEGPLAAAPGPVLQYNYECGLAYDEQGYSQLTIRGTLEIPLNRINTSSRDIARTVDDVRQRWLDIDVDLTKFKVARRSFQYSRDKRTVEWEFVAEELAPMGLPVGCTDARGSMSVRQLRMGGGAKLSMFTGVIWTATLRADYTVAKTFPRRTALEAFFALLWFRMHCSSSYKQATTGTPANAPQQSPVNTQSVLHGGQMLAASVATAGLAGAMEVGYNAGKLFRRMFTSVQQQAKKAPEWNAILSDFGFDEGLYADSKSMRFEASWYILVRWQDIIGASGVWRWLGPDSGSPPAGSPNTTLIGGTAWAQSVRNIMGWTSWLSNRLDPDADVIVDLGGP